MVAQIRTYTINKGMMESWLEIFDKESDQSMIGSEHPLWPPT